MMLRCLIIVMLINSIASEITIECFEMFNQWSVNFGKVYQSSEATIRAVENFISNKELVEAHNLKFVAHQVFFKVGLWEKK